MDAIKIYKGPLFTHGETGYEGSPWALQDDNFISPDGQQWSYDGLHILENGDILEVSDEKGNHVWTGIVMLQGTAWRTVPTNMAYDEWREMFSHYPDYYRARLIKRADWLNQET